MLPIIIPSDATMQLPRLPSPHPGTAQPIPNVVKGRAMATDETGLLGIILPAPPPSEKTPAPERDKWSGEPLPPPVKAIKAGDGYRSVHSEYTRTTVGSVIRSTLRGTGELMITFGLVVLLFAAYEVWGKTAIVDAHQNELAQQLDEIWGPDPTVSQSAGAPSVGPSPTAGPNLANVIAKLYIPKLTSSGSSCRACLSRTFAMRPGTIPGAPTPGSRATSR